MTLSGSYSCMLYVYTKHGIRNICLPLFPSPFLYRFRMEDFNSDATYKTFDNSLSTSVTQNAGTSSELPSRYKTKSKTSEEKERLRQARRTRRTMRLEQQQQEQQQKKVEEQRQIKGDSSSEDTHYKISYSSSSEESSVDENFDVVSIAESEMESLT